MTLELEVLDESAMQALGGQLGEALGWRGCIWLEGDLGAGKTTFSRGLIRAAGHVGAVKSPTFTLVEPYSLATGDIFHFDLYRLADPEELEFLGIRDYFTDNSLCLVEWPDKGAGILPSPDLHITIATQGSGRRLHISAGSSAGQTACKRLQGEA